MVVVNLFGAPGSGKSTGAAYIFAKLKSLGINAELVTEFAKDKVWEENDMVLKNQPYIFGKQYHRIFRCEDKVDVVVTDSPLVLSALYIDKGAVYKEELTQLVNKIFSSYKNMNYFLTRVKPYNPSGRLQTEEESDGLVNKLRHMLYDYQVDFNEINGDEIGYDFIIKKVLEKLIDEKELK